MKDIGKIVAITINSKEIKILINGSNTKIGLQIVWKRLKILDKENNTYFVEDKR